MELEVIAVIGGFFLALAYAIYAIWKSKQKLSRTITLSVA